MGQKPNSARTNQTRNQVLPRTELNPKVQSVQEPEQIHIARHKELNRKLGFLLNEIVGTFTYFTVNETFHVT